MKQQYLISLDNPESSFSIVKKYVKVESWPCDLTVPDIPRNISRAAAAALGE